MNQKLQERLDQIPGIILSDEFLTKKGLGGDLCFWIFDYPAEHELQARQYLKFLTNLENLDCVAESLCLHAITAKKGEDSLYTLRRYLSTPFYRDHMRTYKKRPIYWLFSSGKEKVFECLVYLHRYNEGKLARMRTECVIPRASKFASYAEKLERDKTSSESATEIKVLEKEIKDLRKQQAELSTFDEKLKHFADQRIRLDLDVGVKVNFDKFGDLLTCVKDIHCSVPEIA